MLARLDHDGAAGRQCRACLAGDHGDREIPRGDRCDHANRLLERDNAFVGAMGRDHVAVYPFGFFGEPFDKRGAISHFTAGFG